MALLWFGVFTGMYGGRLLAGSWVIPFLLGMPGSAVWREADSVVTYLIVIPGVLFCGAVFPAWARVLRWVFWFQVVVGPAAIATDVLANHPPLLSQVNNVLVLAAFLALIGGLFRERERTVSVRTLQAGILFACATVVINNLSGLGLFHLPLNPEPVGLAVFLIAAGRVVALRNIQDQERLASIESELAVARRIQASILPRELPKERNLRIATRYLPMTAVAGDFYDFLIVDDHRVGFLIADVSGHGVPAALIASMVKVAIAAQFPHAADPARVIAGMNQTLSGKLQGQFVTAGYLFLDTELGVMRYAGAGHPPLLRRTAAGAVETVAENGLILGIMGSAAYRSVEQELAAGDRFVLYTDGFLEATQSPDEFFGDARLAEILSNSGSFTATECAASLVDGLAAWAGYGSSRGQEDDLTVVVVDVLSLA